MFVTASEPIMANETRKKTSAKIIKHMFSGLIPRCEEIMKKKLMKGNKSVAKHQ